MLSHKQRVQPFSCCRSKSLPPRRARVARSRATKYQPLRRPVGANKFARTNSPNLTDTLQQQVPAAVSIDVNGNDFSQEFYYRGFVASPLIEQQQGVAAIYGGVKMTF